MPKGLFVLAPAEQPPETEVQTTICGRCGGAVVASQVLARKSRHVMRRAWSESNLLDILDFDLQEGYAYHVLTGGDIDSMSFLKHIIRTQHLDYLLLSTWCMALDDVTQLEQWIDDGKIARLDAYVGEIFPGSYKVPHAALIETVRKRGGRVGVFKNHSKVFAGIGPKYAFVVESSANVNTNPRTENTTITIDRPLFEFFKEFYDGIVSFSHDFPGWQPWEGEKNG